MIAIIQSLDVFTAIFILSAMLMIASLCLLLPKKGEYISVGVMSCISICLIGFVVINPSLTSGFGFIKNYSIPLIVISIFNIFTICMNGVGTKSRVLSSHVSCLSLIGAFLLFSADNFIVYFVSLFALMISSGGQILLSEKRNSERGGLKYLLNGSVSMILMFSAIILYYVFTGSMMFSVEFENYGLIYYLFVLILSAVMMISLGVFPFHGHVLDTVSSLSKGAIVSYFFTIKLPVIVSLMALTKFYTMKLSISDQEVIYNIFVGVAFLTLFFGAICGIVQKKLDRIVGCTFIVLCGYLVLSMCINNETVRLFQTSYFIFSYFLAIVGILLLINTLRPYDHNKRTKSFQMFDRIALGIFVLSIIGIPGTSGCIARLLLFSAFIEYGYLVHTLILLSAGVLVVVCYTRFIMVMFPYSEVSNSGWPYFHLAARERFAIYGMALLVLLAGIIPSYFHGVL